MVRIRTPDLLLAALDPLDYFRTQIDGPELVRRVYALDIRDTKVKSVLMHDRADEAEVQATLDELRRDGIEVRGIRFSEVPEHIGTIVQELIGV